MKSTRHDINLHNLRTVRAREVGHYSSGTSDIPNGRQKMTQAIVELELIRGSWTSGNPTGGLQEDATQARNVAPQL